MPRDNFAGLQESGESWRRLGALARNAVRGLRRDPLFVVVAFGSLVAGMCACALAFSAIDAAWLAPQLGRDPQRAVIVFEVASKQCPTCFDTFSAATYERWRDADLHSFLALGGFEVSTVDLSSNTDPERITAAAVDAGFFAALDIRPVAGRIPSESECKGGGQAIVSEGLAKRRFSSSQSAIGKPLIANGGDYVVVAVLPSGFAFPDGSQLWFACSDWKSAATSATRTLAAVGRLRDQVAPQVAADEMRAITQGAPTETNSGRSFAVIPLVTWASQHTTSGHWLLAFAVWLTFSVACINLICVNMVRAQRRSRETAIRVALGATVWENARLLLGEGALLAVPSGCVALLIARRLLDEVSLVARNDLGVAVDLTMNVRVVAATMVLSVLVGIAIGLVPVFTAAHFDLLAAIGKSGHAATARPEQRRLHRTFVIGQISVVTALALGAALFSSSYRFTQRLDLGFDASGTLIATPALDTLRWRSAGGPRALAGILTRAFDEAGFASHVSVWFRRPIYAKYRGNSLAEPVVTVDGRSDLLDKRTIPIVFDGPAAAMQAIGIPVVRGRAFTLADEASHPSAVIVNEAAARMYWPGQDPIGKRVKIGPPTSDADWMTVVGIAAGSVPPDPAGLGLALVNPGREWPILFCPPSDRASWLITVLARVDPASRASVGEIQKTLRATLGDRTGIALRRMRDVMNGSWPVSTLRLETIALVASATVGLLLACIGIYSVLADSVQQRTREIGIRVAVGAAPGHVFFMLVWESVRTALTGVAIGTALFVLMKLFAPRLAFGVAGGLQNGLLFGVDAWNAGFYVAVWVSMLVLGVLAALAPAWRAVRLDPIRSLSQE